MISPDAFVTWANKIDDRTGPISGRDADALATFLRLAGLQQRQNIRALEQAQDCIRGETPEECTQDEARQDTILKIREALGL